VEPTDADDEDALPPLPPASCIEPVAPVNLEIEARPLPGADAGTAVIPPPGPGPHQIAAGSSNRPPSSIIRKSKPPRNGVEFEMGWKRLKSDVHQHAAYIRQIPADQLPRVIKQVLTPTLLSSLLQAILGPVLHESAEDALQLVESLTRIPRFAMNVLSLSAAQKSELAGVWDAAVAHCMVLDSQKSDHAQSSSLKTLRAQFGV